MTQTLSRSQEMISVLTSNSPWSEVPHLWAAKNRHIILRLEGSRACEVSRIRVTVASHPAI
jgi:hypothetical protein